MAHYFIAIPIPKDIQTFYDGWQKELQPILPYKRWMHMEDLHITLKFLGEVDETSINTLMKKVSQLSLPKSFIIDLGKIGFFGGIERPRVMWVDVKKSTELLSMQADLEEALNQIGFKKDKREYRPHMTLAKKWEGAAAFSDDLRTTLQKKYTLTKEFNVSEITLFRIHPKKEPSYEAVATIPLM